MASWSMIFKEPLVLISAAALLLTAGVGLLIESVGTGDDADAAPATPTVTPPSPLPVAPEVVPAPGYNPMEALSAPWPDDGRQTLMTFVHLSDTHVGNEDDHKTFADAIDQINALEPRPAFVVITGDLTDNFTSHQIRLFKEVLGRLKPAVYLVPGNHDVMFDPNPKRIAWWEREFPQFATPFRADEGPFALIGVDSQLWNSRRRTRAVDEIAQAQWERMEEMLAKARAEGKRILILDHIPAPPTFYPGRTSQSWETDRMNAFLGLLDRHEVEAELSGHVHRDEMYVHGRTLFLSAPPISQKYTRNASLRLFRVTPDGLMYRQAYLYRRASHLSYQFDLHGVDEARFHQWVGELDDEGLGALWMYRYAGDTMTERWFTVLDRDRFRQYVKNPFEFQPVGKIHQRHKAFNARASKKKPRRSQGDR